MSTSGLRSETGKKESLAWQERMLRDANINSTAFRLRRIDRCFLLPTASSTQLIPPCTLTQHHPTLHQQQPKYVATVPVIDCWHTHKLNTEVSKNNSVWVLWRWPGRFLTGLTKALSDACLLVNICTYFFGGINSYSQFFFHLYINTCR